MMTHSNPKVSVIVPVYNAEDYIGETIRSVLNQSYENWELLLIDDGSIDRSREIIEEYLDDERITYFYQRNSGQGSARNRGIKMSNGVYVAFLDADDLWNANKLQAQVPILLKGEASLVFSKVRCIDEKGRYLERGLGNGAGTYHGFRTLFLLVSGNIAVPNSSVMATRESIVEAGGFDEDDRVRNMEDYDLWIRMLKSGYSFYGMDEALASYRKHRGQSTYSDSGQNLKMVHYLDNRSKEYPERKTYFKFLILHRLSSYYKGHNQSAEAKKIALKTFYSLSSIDSYWFEKYLIHIVNFANYLKFRGLLIRRFRRLDRFVQSIDE